MPVNITQPNGQVLSVDVLGGTQSLSLGPVRDASAALDLGILSEGQSMRFAIGPNFINAATATASAGDGGGGDPGGGGGGGGGGGIYDGKFVMFLPAGQSNAIGRAGPIDVVLDATDADILQYDAAGDSYILAEDPIDHFNENPDQIGFVMTFAKDFKTANPALNKVLIVGGGLGGSGFINGRWNAGGNGSHYEDAKARWNAAYARAVAAYGVGNVVVGGILWVQGEDEAIDFPALFNGADGDLQFATMPQSLFTSIRNSWDGMSSETPVVVAEVPEGTALNATAVAEINAGILAIPNFLPFSSSINQDGTTYVDDRHWDATSLREMGSRFATALPSALTNDAVGTLAGFTEDAANVETAFAFSAVGMPDGGLVFPSAGVSAWNEFDNKRVCIKGGRYIFDGDAEIRLRRAGKPQLGTRDFVFKFVFMTNSSAQQGIVADFESETNQRGFVCRYNSGGLQFYMSNNGTSGTLMLEYALSTGVEYEIEIRRVGTALTLHVDGVLRDSYTLSSGYDVFTTPDAQSLLIGDFINFTELDGYIESISLEFLSA